MVRMRVRWRAGVGCTGAAQGLGRVVYTGYLVRFSASAVV